MKEKKDWRLEDFDFLDLDTAMHPTGKAGNIYTLYHNYWWVIHPERGLAFWKARLRYRERRWVNPICNLNEIIVRKFTGYIPFEHSVVQVERVFLPFDQRDLRT